MAVPLPVGSHAVVGHTYNWTTQVNTVTVAVAENNTNHGTKVVMNRYQTIYHS